MKQKRNIYQSFTKSIFRGNGEAVFGSLVVNVKSSIELVETRHNLTDGMFVNNFW